MLQPAEHLGFVLEPAEDVRMTETAPEHFDRDRAARPILLRRIDDAHAAGAERVQHEKAAEAGAGLERAVDGGHVERRDLLGIEEVVVGDVERRDQRFDFAPEGGVVAAARVEKCGAIARDRRPRAPERSLRRRAASRTSIGGRLAERAERAVQPRPRERPFVLHRRRRQIERGRGFFDAQTGEVPQRDDLRFARVGLLEARQRLVDGDEIGQRRVGAHDRAVEVDALRRRCHA